MARSNRYVDPEDIFQDAIRKQKEKQEKIVNEDKETKLPSLADVMKPN